MSKDVLTVFGFGSRILCNNVFAPEENQNGQVNSAALIYTFKGKTTRVNNEI